MNMNSNNYKNEISDDDRRQHFQRIRPDWFQKTRQPAVPSLFEQTITTTTTTRINKELNSKVDEMTTTHLEKSPMRRVNIASGPQSAFARLFPDKYRQEQEELRQKQTLQSSNDQRYNFDRNNFQRIISDDDEEVKISRRVPLYYRENNDYSSDQNGLKSRSKSDSFLNQNSFYYSDESATKKDDETLARMPLNYDPDPEIIYRDNPDKVVYVQKVGVRYLKPPTPPPPGPLVIREIQSTPPKQPPPLVVSTTPPIAPRTPSPLIVREQPPTPPPHRPAKVITKTLPAPPAAPRRVIIKRIPPLPAKPRPVIIEKWLPYKPPPERPVLYERAVRPEQTPSTQRNVILQYEPARVRVEQEIQNVGYYRVDPEIYRAEYGSSLRRTDSIRKVLEDIGCDPNLITSTGYSTSYPSNQTNNSSHYDIPKETRTCFTDEQLAELINPSTPTNHHYDISSTSRDINQVYYTTVPSNSSKKQ